MTVKEAQQIVRKKYPQAIVGVVRGMGWKAAKAYPFGGVVGPYAETSGQAWKRAAESLLRKNSIR